MIEIGNEPEPAEFDIATVLNALADPVRLAYVRGLDALGGGSWCGRVLDETGIQISKSTLSHHLRVLRDAGLTHTRIEGVRRHVTLRRSEMDARFPGLLDAVCERRLARAEG
jgi:DNA-binding transcriptional ArsR family regulator